MSIQTHEVIFSGVLSGQFVQNVMHVKIDTPSPVNAFLESVQIVNEINTGGIQAAWTDMLPVDYTQTSLRVRRVLPSGGPTAIITGGALTQAGGQRTGSISSAQVSPLLIWIGTTTPARTGRTFLPGVSETDIDDMILVVGLTNDMITFANAWIAGGSPAAGTFVGTILRRLPSVSSDTILSGTISPLIGTQRRRLRPV